jgi:indole-3-glycerol phosphate synthase
MSTNILAKIVETKFGEVAERKKQVTIAQLQAMPLFEKPGYSLKANIIDASKTGIIAEFKRQSPSKGIINAVASVEEVAKAYTQFGASGISVLTDGQYFGGSLADLSFAQRIYH